MKKDRQRILSPAAAMGIILLGAAVILAFFNPLLAAAVAMFYVVLCIAASFFPESGFFLPVISRGNTGKKYVALTFDDGPAEPTTRQILDLLDKHSMKATFFVAGVKSAAHPGIIKEI
ncbi:MAG TPA: polysaccharide deacetylase family protein, partial [Smithellaceae bacterium]|nr:polysaccharide deacetylase family protein [Smithellaceae bacterium]